MGVDIDTVNLEVDINGKGHLSFNGHFVNVSDENGLSLYCSACGHSESFERSPDGLYKWEATFYLLGCFPDSCNGDGNDLEERIHTVLDRYVGKPADQGRIASIEKEVRDIVGEDVPVTVRAP